MAFYDGPGSNGLAVIVDSRSKVCEEDNQVLHNWALGRRALGRNGWSQTLKVALREYGTDPWAASRVKSAKLEIATELKRRGITTIVPVQTANIPNVRQVHSAWNMFGAPGNPYKWAGTVWKQDDFYVAPILHPGNYEYVYGWLLERWLRQAAAVARGVLAPLPWPTLHIHTSLEMVAILRRMLKARAPTAIDIETNMAGTMVSAIGFSNECGTVSVPWHEYVITGTNGEIEPSLESRPYGEQIKGLAVSVLEDASVPKILHNGAFDVLQLAKYSITLRGFEHDTLLMHRVVYPQYRHGLQQSCATEFCVGPWKCLFKPPKQRDGGDIWLGCPIELRRYNSKDTYATWQLYNHLKDKLG